MDPGSLPTFCTLWLRLKSIFTFYFAISFWRTKSWLLCAFFLFLRSCFILRKCWWSCGGWAPLRKKKYPNIQVLKFQQYKLKKKKKIRFDVMPIKIWFLLFSITARILPWTKPSMQPHKSSWGSLTYLLGNSSSSKWLFSSFVSQKIVFLCFALTLLCCCYTSMSCYYVVLKRGIMYYFCKALWYWKAAGSPFSF